MEVGVLASPSAPRDDDDRAPSSPKLADTFFPQAPLIDLKDYAAHHQHGLHLRRWSAPLPGRLAAASSAPLTPAFLSSSHQSQHPVSTRCESPPPPYRARDHDFSSQSLPASPAFPPPAPHPTLLDLIAHLNKQSLAMIPSSPPRKSSISRLFGKLSGRSKDHHPPRSLRPRISAPLELSLDSHHHVHLRRDSEFGILTPLESPTHSIPCASPDDLYFQVDLHDASDDALPPSPAEPPVYLKPDVYQKPQRVRRLSPRSSRSSSFLSSPLVPIQENQATAEFNPSLSVRNVPMFGGCELFGGANDSTQTEPDQPSFQFDAPPSQTRTDCEYSHPVPFGQAGFQGRRAHAPAALDLDQKSRSPHSSLPVTDRLAHPFSRPSNPLNRVQNHVSANVSFGDCLRSGTTVLGLRAIRGLVSMGQCLVASLEDEPPLKHGHVRVRWTCKCGEKLHDDFIEVQPGAARELELELNRGDIALPPHSPTTHHQSKRSLAATQFSETPTGSDSVPSSASSAVFSLSPSSSISATTSADIADTPLTPLSSSPSPTKVSSGGSSHIVTLGPSAEPSWLLTCIPESKRAPKVHHLSVDSSSMKSDRDLALALRELYASVATPYLPRLRGLKAIEFVQFEMHTNRFADIRARPHMPPSPLDSSHVVSEHPYAFEATPLLPPVGSNYLMHLLAHPHDYDSENVTLSRAPKRLGRLDAGTGWGVELVEGFLAARVWGLITCGFCGVSALFAALWIAWEGRDVQGAFAVASWIVMFAALAGGWVQACVE